MSDKLFCAIDIGSSKIATIIALQAKDDQTLRVIGFNATVSKGIKKGLIVDIDKVTKAVEDSVEKAERMAGQKVRSAVVSVGGPHISSINSHGVVAVANPRFEISESDVDRVVEAARAISLSTTRQIIEVSPREFVVDGQEGIKNPVGMSGVRLEVNTHIITASQTNLKNIGRCLDDLGIENEGFIFAGLASSEAVLTDTERELGVAVVDIGGGKTDIALYIEGALSYSSSIPVGAKHITNDIAVGLRVSLDSAEKIKLMLARYIQQHHPLPKQKTEDKVSIADLNLPEEITEISLKTVVDGIIGPRLEELFRLIGEELNKSTFMEQVPSGIVITGGGALTLGMIPLGKKVLSMPIRTGVPGNVVGLVDEILNPQFSTTVGLILYAQKNIMREHQTKDFNKILKDLSVGSTVGKLTQFIKQFIP